MIEQIKELRETLLKEAVEYGQNEAEASEVAEYQRAAYWKGKQDAYGEIVNSLSDIIKNDIVGIPAEQIECYHCKNQTRGDEVVELGEMTVCIPCMDAYERGDWE